MIFNSLPFVIFLVLVFALHWMPLTRDGRHQNTVLLLASYVFYGWWDPRFLVLILFSSLVDYFLALRIGATADPRMRHTWLMLSVAANLGLLFFFKYFNFFVSSFKLAFGLPEVPSTLDIILPVGISFYTFQTMSYTIDVYHRRMEPTRDLPRFLTFVAFFPQLVAGPIERARALLPQFGRPRTFDHDTAVAGCRLILLGAFKKIVVADRIAPITDGIFATPGAQAGWIAFLGLALFFIQVYGDFSGYSDIAIGTARLFSIGLMLNFDRPFFSTSLKEFWGRWHISLMTWFRDYLYIPLGGGRVSRWKAHRNVFLTFLLSGLWHGAHWNFVIWGGLHGVLVITEQRMRLADARWPGWLKWPLIFIPFTLTMVFFRSPTLEHALFYLQGLFTRAADGEMLFSLLRRNEISLFAFGITMLMIAMLLLLERASFSSRITNSFRGSTWMRRMGYATMILLIGLFGVFTDPRAFVYFQF